MAQVNTRGQAQPPADETMTTTPLGTSETAAPPEDAGAPSSTKKHDTFDPYRYGRIQFTSRFFKMLVSTPLPEVPSEDLIRPEDLVSPPVRRSEGPRGTMRVSEPPVAIPIAGVGTRRALALPLLGVAVVLLGMGAWFFGRSDGEGRAAVTPPGEPRVDTIPASVSAQFSSAAPTVIEPPPKAESADAAPQSPAKSGASSQTKSPTSKGPGSAKAKAPATTATKNSGDVYFEPD